MQAFEEELVQSHKNRLDLGKLMAPNSIAIVGASLDSKRVGGEIVENLKSGGYKGRVFPINPKYSEINGYTCYPDLTAIGQPVDLAVIAVNLEQVIPVIRQCGQAKISLAMVLSSGFSEAGETGAALQKQLDQAASEAKVRIVGPNCIGLMNTKKHMYCGFGPGFRKHGISTGPVAMVTQSGGFGFSVVGLCNGQGLGFSQIVSTGNESDVSTADLIDHILDDDEIKVIVAYIEGVKDGRRLMQVGEKALALGKPILCWKVGNSIVGRNAVASHTANLSAPYDLFKSAFARGGFIEIREIEDLVDIARGFLGGYLPRGRAVAVVTTSGGSGVLMADRCDEAGLSLPALPASLAETVAQILPPHSAISNPVDMTAQLGDDGQKFNKVVRSIAENPSFDQLLIRYGAVQSANAPAWASELATIVSACKKPILVAWSRTPDHSSKALNILEAARVPWFVTPGRAVTAAAALSDFACRQVKVRRQAPNTDALIKKVSIDIALHRPTLGEHASKQIIASYGIPVVKEKLIKLNELEMLRRSPVGFPVVVKIESPDIPHKTEAGCVAMGIRSLRELKSSAQKLVQNAQSYHPNAAIDGVLVQETCVGTELILGAFVDKCFGPVVILGLGGIYAEVLKDIVRRFAPLSKADAHEMILELKSAPIFTGYRGKPLLDTDALADAIFRLGQLIYHHQDRIQEIDINPLFIREVGLGVKAADSLVITRERN